MTPAIVAMPTPLALGPTMTPAVVDGTLNNITVDALKNEYGVWRILVLSLVPVGLLLSLALLLGRRR
jgi:hypothetical protein